MSKGSCKQIQQKAFGLFLQGGSRQRGQKLRSSPRVQAAAGLELGAPQLHTFVIL